MMDPTQKLKKIVKKVLWVHLFILLFLMINFKGFKKKPPAQKMALRENFRVIEKPKPKKQIARAVAKAKPAPSKKTTSQTKTTSVKKPEVKAKPASPKKAEVKTASKTEKKEPVQFEKIKELPPSPKESMPLKIPEAIAKLSIEEQKEAIDEDEEMAIGRYMEYLQARIYEDLTLGSRCFVSLELTLNREGQIVNIKHKKSSDPLSKDYIIENLSKMEFSHFFGEVVNESEYTFVLTLKDPFL